MRSHYWIMLPSVMFESQSILASLLIISMQSIMHTCTHTYMNMVYIRCDSSLSFSLDCYLRLDMTNHLLLTCLFLTLQKGMRYSGQSPIIPYQSHIHVIHTDSTLDDVIIFWHTQPHGHHNPGQYPLDFMINLCTCSTK